MSIPEHVDTAMQGGALRQYRAQAQPVVDSLVQREQDLCDAAATAAAEKFHVDREVVLQFLEEQGYHVTQAPDPLDEAADAVAVEQPGTAALFADLRTRVERLEEVARRAGLIR